MTKERIKATKAELMEMLKQSEIEMERLGSRVVDKYNTDAENELLRTVIREIASQEDTSRKERERRRTLAKKIDSQRFIERLRTNGWRQVLKFKDIITFEKVIGGETFSVTVPEDTNDAYNVEIMEQAVDELAIAVITEELL